MKVVAMVDRFGCLENRNRFLGGGDRYYEATGRRKKKVIFTNCFFGSDADLQICRFADCIRGIFLTGRCRSDLSHTRSGDRFESLPCTVGLKCKVTYFFLESCRNFCVCMTPNRRCTLSKNLNLPLRGDCVTTANQNDRFKFIGTRTRKCSSGLKPFGRDCKMILRAHPQPPSIADTLLVRRKVGRCRRTTERSTRRRLGIICYLRVLLPRSQITSILM